MKDDLDQIKSDPAVLRVYSQYLRLQKNGDKYSALCPFHQEKTPSFTIFPDMRWTCYGQCATSGNVFQLVERLENCDFKQALEKVKAVIGDGGWQKAKDVVDKTFRSVSEPKAYKTIPLSQFLKLENSLQGNVSALRWLKEERGISAETAKKAHLGFTQSIGNLAGTEGKEVADQGWIAFPCLDGDVVRSVKYRSIAAKKFSRQPGMATELFGLEDIDPFENIYVVEGEIDRLTLLECGFRSVSIASASTKLTPQQKDRIMQASCIFLAGDNDEAGKGATDRLWKELQDRTYKLEWPNGLKDANETFVKHCNRDKEKFVQLMDELTRKAKAQPMPNVYSIQETLRNSDDKSLSDRPDRLHFPWKPVDEGAILLPGSVLGIMATQTGQGKSALATNISLYGARSWNETVVAWQCELSPEEVGVMVAAQVLRKNRNFLTKEDRREAADRLGDIQYYVGNDPNARSITEVLDIIEAAIRRLGATVAVLDNLHYYTTGIDDENRAQAAAMKRIKEISVKYGTKFIVVFQPRKATQQGKGKKTHITDVKGSAAAGDTCDAVLAIHRDLTKGDDAGEKQDIYEERTLAEWLKTRAKGVGKSSCYLHFFGEFAAFEFIDTVHEEQPN